MVVWMLRIEHDLLKEQTVFSAAELSLYSTIIIIIIILKSSSNNILFGTVSFWFQVCLIKT